MAKLKSDDAAKLMQGSGNLPRRKFLENLAGISTVGLFGAQGNAVERQATESTTNRIDLLRNDISGKVIARNDADYELWRQSMIWQASKPNRFPNLIVQAITSEDVITAVKFARGQGMKIIAKGAGHSLCGSFLRDKGITLDVSGLREVSVDSQKQTAIAGPGFGSTDLLKLLEPYGLAFPVAQCGTVSLSGYLLGGGLGYNISNWGVACASVLGADVVNADGELITVNLDQYPDLFSAIRGAGLGFFGVVTKYYLRLHPLPRTVASSTYVLPASRIQEGMQAVEALLAFEIASLELGLHITANPENHQLALGSEKQHVCTVRAVAYANDEKEASQILAHVANSALGKISISKKELEFTSLTTMSAQSSDLYPRWRFATNDLWTNSPTETLVVLAKYLEKAPSKMTTISASFVGIARPPDDVSYSIMGKSHIICIPLWKDPNDDVANRAWMHEATAAVQPYSIGHYVNDADIVSSPERVRRSFSQKNWGRLRALRRKYDPDGLFHDYYGHPS